MTNNDILICEAFHRLLSTPSAELKQKLGAQIPLNIANYIAELPPEETLDPSVMATRISEFCERPENEALDDWFLDIYNSLGEDDIKKLVKKTGDPGDGADENLEIIITNEGRDISVSLAWRSLEILKNEGTNEPPTSNLILKQENFLNSLKLVVINIGDGNWENGFSASARILNNGHPLPYDVPGKLPPQPELPELYKQWWEAYDNFILGKGIFSKGLTAAPNQQTNFSTEEVKKELKERAAKISESLNNWLKSEAFSPIQNKIRTEFLRDEELRIILQTSNVVMRRLPWHLWNLFKDYSQAEIAFSPPESDKKTPKISGAKTRILVVLGQAKKESNGGINLEPDKQIIESLTDAETVFLTEPTREELNKALWQEPGWQILCFSGHSSSNWDDSKGWIQINPKEALNLEELKYALTAAIDRGLQLAIFNSCNGMGLATQLADLHLPQIIVMRERVPDLVAQEFVKNFFELFAKQGKSLYLSVRQAREKLQSMEDKFPCATWLPVICQNSATLPLNWQELKGGNRRMT